LFAKQLSLIRSPDVLTYFENLRLAGMGIGLPPSAGLGQFVQTLQQALSAPGRQALGAPLRDDG